MENYNDLKEKGWELMLEKLNKEMPVKEEKKRFWVWYFTPAMLLVGLLTYGWYHFSDDSKGLNNQLNNEQIKSKNDSKNIDKNAIVNEGIEDVKVQNIETKSNENINNNDTKNNTDLPSSITNITNLSNTKNLKSSKNVINETKGLNNQEYKEVRKEEIDLTIYERNEDVLLNSKTKGNETNDPKYYDKSLNQTLIPELNENQELVHKLITTLPLSQKEPSKIIYLDRKLDLDRINFENQVRPKSDLHKKLNLALTLNFLTSLKDHNGYSVEFENKTKFHDKLYFNYGLNYTFINYKQDIAYQNLYVASNAINPLAQSLSQNIVTNNQYLGAKIGLVYEFSSKFYTTFNTNLLYNLIKEDNVYLENADFDNEPTLKNYNPDVPLTEKLGNPSILNAIHLGFGYKISRKLETKIGFNHFLTNNTNFSRYNLFNTSLKYNF